MELQGEGYKDPMVPARSLSPDKVVRQLEELVAILRKQINMLEGKNRVLSEQNNLLLLREQTCMCFAAQQPLMDQSSPSDKNQVGDSGAIDKQISSHDMSNNCGHEDGKDEEMETDNDFQAVYIPRGPRIDIIEGPESDENDSTEQVENESITLQLGDLGSIRILGNDSNKDGPWTTAQRIGWPITNGSTNYELVLVSQRSGPEPDGTDDELEDGANSHFNDTDMPNNTYEPVESEPEHPIPRVRPLGQRGKLAKEITCYCQVCGKGLSGKRSLRQHMPIHTGQKKHNCEVCSMSFITKSNLTRHIRKHTGEKPYPCLICGRTFAHLGDVQMHTRTHTGERPYPCDLCESTFVTNAHLRRHIKSHARKPGWLGNERAGYGEQNTHLCQMCGKVFIKKSVLKRHLTNHEKKSIREEESGKKPKGDRKKCEGTFMCVECPKSFPTQSRLTRHENTHFKNPKTKRATANKKFKCPKCSRFFVKARNLEMHLICHAEKIRQKAKKGGSTEPRTFTCGHCFVAYKTRFQVNQHMKKHVDEPEDNLFF